VHGQINLDFNDIKTVMAEMGKAMMGTGEADGEGRATRAAEAAINNPLLEETSMAGARGLLINITGGDDLTLFEVDEAVSTVRKQVDEEANVLFGSATDPSLEGRIRVSVVATGIDALRDQEQPRPKLVAVNGGGAYAEPRPIPVPAGAPVFQTQVTEPIAREASNITALRQHSQPERVVIPDPMPYPDESLVAHMAPTRRPAPVGVPSALSVEQSNPIATSSSRPASSLFGHSPATTTPPLGESVARSLFQSATGLFRKRAPSSPVPEASPVRRREPSATDQVEMAPPGELVMEAERPADRRSMALDDGSLDIPAFLRRQSS
jgi:cell division protein FtsZ